MSKNQNPQPPKSPINIFDLWRTLLRALTDLIDGKNLKINFFIVLSFFLLILPLIKDLEYELEVIYISVALIILLSSYVVIFIGYLRTTIPKVPNAPDNSESLRILNPICKNRSKELETGRLHALLCPRDLGFVFGLIASLMFYWHAPDSILNSITMRYHSLGLFRFLLLIFISYPIIKNAVLRRLATNRQENNDSNYVKVLLFIAGFINGAVSILWIFEIFSNTTFS